MRSHGLGILSFLWLSGCGLDNSYDPNQYVYTGRDARQHIVRQAKTAASLRVNADGFPASARNFWMFDGGSFNGSIRYWMFDCDNLEDCLKAIRYLGDIKAEELKPWEPSRYAVVMEGLDFYSRNHRWKKLIANPWDVRGIKNGVVYERTSERSSESNRYQRMVYFAIDFEKYRIYHHYESGGFPPDQYRPSGPKKTED